MRGLAALLLCPILALASCKAESGGGNDDGGGTPQPTGTVPIALPDLVDGNYLGHPGGLYPGGNDIPSGHLAEGTIRANAIGPLGVAGTSSAGGAVVMVSIGMSNTTQEFCSQNGLLPCGSWTFVGQAEASGSKAANVRLVNGARGGQTAQTWDSATDPNYDDVRDNRLAPAGLTESQVQVAWVKVADANPTLSLPDPGADANVLLTHLGNVMRALATRYPNLKLVFVSSRIYAGYATTALNPEPFAYESGFAVKWLVEAQIEQIAGSAPDARAGDLDYSDGTAPWIAWGPYLWADGMTANGDGLTWASGDFEGDGTHPAQSGEQKVGSALLDFFTTSGVTACWFTVAGTCP